MKHFTCASLHSIQEKNVLNSQTFYFSILFQRSFLSAFRGLLSRDIPSLELCIPFTVYFYSFHTFVTSFTPFLCISYIQRARNIFSSLMMRLMGQSLDFRFQFLNSSLRPHQNSFIFLIMLLMDNMNRSNHIKLKVVVHVLKPDGLTEVIALASLDDLCKY